MELLVAFKRFSASWLRFRTSSTLIIATVCVAAFTDAFLYGITIPVFPFALPKLTGIGDEEVEVWCSALLASYGGTILVGSPFFGWVGDRLSSRKAMLLGGLALLSVSTLLTMFARQTWELAVSRIFAGASAAAMLTAGNAMLVDSFGAKRFTEIIGFTTTAMSIGQFSGPLIGGFVYSNASYRILYLTAIGVVLVDILFHVTMIERANSEDNAASDDSRPGAIKEDDEKGLYRTISLMSIKRTYSSVVSETKELKTLSTLLTSPKILVCLWNCFIQSSIITSFDVILPFFVKRTFDWTSQGAGLMFLAIFLPSVFAPIGGIVANKLGPRIVTVVGFLVSGLMLALLRLVSYHSTSQVGILAGLLTVIGFSIHIIIPPILSEMLREAMGMQQRRMEVFKSASVYSQVFGLSNAALALGSLIGPLVGGWAFFELGWANITLLMSLLTCSAIVPSWFMMSKVFTN